MEELTIQQSFTICFWLAIILILGFSFIEIYDKLMNGTLRYNIQEKKIKLRDRKLSVEEMKNVVALRESESSYYETIPSTNKAIGGGLVYYSYIEPSMKIKISGLHGKKMIENGINLQSLVKNKKYLT